MTGSITFHPADADGVARVVLANDGKLNAIDIAMWRALRSRVATSSCSEPGRSEVGVTMAKIYNQ